MSDEAGTQAERAKIKITKYTPDTCIFSAFSCSKIHVCGSLPRPQKTSPPLSAIGVDVQLFWPLALYGLLI